VEREETERERGSTGLTLIHQMIIRDKDDVILHLQTWMASTDNFDIPSACLSALLSKHFITRKDIRGLLTLLE